MSSLYSFEEVCLLNGKCIYSHYHICEKCFDGSPHFCHCEMHSEANVDHVRGVCKFKIVNKDEDW